MERCCRTVGKYQVWPLGSLAPTRLRSVGTGGRASWIAVQSRGQPHLPRGVYPRRGPAWDTNAFATKPTQQCPANRSMYANTRRVPPRQAVDLMRVSIIAVFERAERYSGSERPCARQSVPFAKSKQSV
jgi:hypothetical protein